MAIDLATQVVLMKAKIFRYPSAIYLLAMAGRQSQVCKVTLGLNSGLEDCSSLVETLAPPTLKSLSTEAEKDKAVLYFKSISHIAEYLIRLEMLVDGSPMKAIASLYNFLRSSC
ncbi:hypothetical protein OUZ56_010302 [Daphnia magna]|uniref:Uncharacterized protein n=1 Tax=Daphnia magna TaxID=35525 RepID=A0ABR0AIL2_9CRUS|nr:hypothetical protein OUZ56_010302 [Daphnia magna]